MELTEVSSKKNSIYTFTSKTNKYFPENYEYCMKISNKSAAVFMNNAIASITISTGIGLEKKGFKWKGKKQLGYFFLKYEQENIINFKIKNKKSPFSISFVSFPDECDIEIVSNSPEKLIYAIEYSQNMLNFAKKTNQHVCYFSGFPFETQLEYEESIVKKHSLKITSNSKVLIEQVTKDPSKESIINIAKIASAVLLEWDIPNEKYDIFQIQMNENKYNYSKNNRLDRNFNRKTKIYQILTENNRTIVGQIKQSLDKSLLLVIIAVFATAFLMVMIITVIVLRKKGICCVKTEVEIEHDSDNWEVNLDQDENEIIYRKPYLVENVENPYEAGKEVVNMIKRESKPIDINTSPILYEQDSITAELLPKSIWK